MLRFMWQWAVLFFEGLVAWLLRPRILILLVVLIVLGTVSWWYFDVPTIGLAVKNFVMKTVPKWVSIGSAWALTQWPKFTALVGRALSKGYFKKTAIGLAPLIATPLFRRRARAIKEAYTVLAIGVAKYYFAYRPKEWIGTRAGRAKGWWGSLSPHAKLLVISASIAVLGTMLGSIIFNLLFVLPLAVMKSFLSLVWRVLFVVLTKFGLGKFIMWVQTKVIGLGWHIMPETTRKKLTKTRKRIAIGVIRRRRILHGKTSTYLNARNKKKLRKKQLQAERELEEVEQELRDTSEESDA